MAATGDVTRRGATATAAFAPRGRASLRTTNLIRAGLVLGVALVWEATSRSGLLFHDVVPSLLDIAAAIWKLLINPEFYANLRVTFWEIFASLAIGSAAGIFAGIVFGSNRFLSQAFEPYVYYLAPTPRIIFFPVMIMWFGVGVASKIALGGLSSFFTVALATAAGMRQIDKVLIRVGRSFRATPWQMAMKIYLPAMRVPVLTGIRLGFGVATITALLAETKLSNQGLGFMIMQIYARFDMPSLYALLIIVFVIAGVGNLILGKVTGTSA
jgi:ABC-type nitrate/sulfonate/bicarbonate transport system permease component